MWERQSVGLRALFSNPAALRHGEAAGELMQGWALVDRKAGKRQSWRCRQEVEAVVHHEEGGGGRLEKIDGRGWILGEWSERTDVMGPGGRASSAGQRWQSPGQVKGWGGCSGQKRSPH